MLYSYRRSNKINSFYFLMLFAFFTFRIWPEIFLERFWTNVITFGRRSVIQYGRYRASVWLRLFWLYVFKGYRFYFCFYHFSIGFWNFRRVWNVLLFLFCFLFLFFCLFINLLSSICLVIIKWNVLEKLEVI